MDNPQDISARFAPLDMDGGQDLPQNTAHLVPRRDLALAGAIAKRPAAPRILLADRIDWQFPLIRSA